MDNSNVIIVAGGSGRRMDSDVPKQFLIINSKPLLYYTLNCFYTFDSSLNIILVLPEKLVDYWRDLCFEYDIQIPHRVALGGEQRFYSVKNGLQLIENNGLVAVHDGVRPLVSHITIKRTLDMARSFGAVIPVTDVVETLRFVDGDASRTVNRADYKLVQTPQVFRKDIIVKAYNQPFNTAFTDDASVVEAAGFPVVTTSGNRENIKITTPEDLKIAKALL